MTINHLRGVTGVYSGYQTPAARPAAKAQEANAGGFELSSVSQSFGAALRKLREHSNDVRADKVAELEQKVTSGNYNVDARDIAASMLAMRY